MNTGVGSEGQRGGCTPPWIFIHGTDIVDRGLIVLFLVFFCYFSVFFPLLPGRGLKYYFSVVFAIFGIFSRSLLEIFLPTPLQMNIIIYSLSLISANI